MPLSVIGAGLPRTGTSSLTLALDQLGFGPCYHMREVLAHPDQAQGWCDAADGKPVDWKEMLKGYRSTTDAPACNFYKPLAELYPDAKVILSVRDPDKWFSSTQETILKPWVMKMHTALGTLEMCNKVGWGDDPKLHDRIYMLARYKRHNDEVRETIPARRLLVFDAKEGWEPLCAFLGVPVPDAPYPHTNSREEFGVREDALAAMSLEEIRQMIAERLRAAGSS